MRNKYTIEIAAPIQRVFQCIFEPQAVMQWLTHVAEYELLDETRDKVGTRVRQVWDDNGQRTELNGEITAYTPHTRLGLRLAGARFKVAVDYVLKDLGGRTELTQETHLQYQGLLRIIDLGAGRLLRKSYAEELKRNFARLTELCQSKGR